MLLEKSRQFAAPSKSRCEPASSHALLHSGQTLFWEGDDASKIFRIEAGAIRAVIYGEDGERQLIGFFMGGNEIGMPSHGCYQYTAEAITDVVYSTVPVESWSDRLRSARALDKEVFGALECELDSCRVRSQLLSRQGALTRICAFLSGLCQRLGSDEAFTVPMPQIDIAAYLALTPETVCRAIRKLKDIGMIEIDRHDHIRVKDARALVPMMTH
ncbi:MAG: Crp/Fnr family transcriptional regulator [Sphingomonadaceae bacterium]|nr:Crp/Fnr family transcriptional regulator [Sphingomonadaceae bacterium]